MSSLTPFCPPPPTWRLCHPVNIYVYQNGLPGLRPVLVHIPMEKKKNMSTVLEEIGNRMKLPVGYPVGLYHMDGQRVCKTYELEMYNNYVVVTNLEKRFKCVEYGRIREPLVVIGSRYSKHVNTLRLQNKKFDLFCRRKMARKPLHELMANSGEQDGYGPGEIPGGKPCGALCHKVTPRRDRVAQCCSDEIMCVEGAAMDLEPDRCREFQRAMEEKLCEVPPCTKEDEESCRLVQELKEKVRGEEECSRASLGVTGGGAGMAGNLKDLMLRYKDVGSDIFRLFQDKICRDLDAGVEGRTVSQRWEIPGGSSLSLETQQKVRDELIRLAQQSCDFAFDKRGNFLYSDGCRIAGTEGRVSDVGVTTADLEGMLGKMEEGFRRRSSGGSKRASLQQTETRRGSGEKKRVEGQGEEDKEKNAGFAEVEVGRLEVEQRDEENNVSTGSIPGPGKEESLKKMEEMLMEGGEEEEEEEGGKDGVAELVKQEVERRESLGRRVSGMQEEITEIVGNLRRSLVMSRSNSQNGGSLPAGMVGAAAQAKKLEAVLEELEEDGEEEEAEELRQILEKVKSTTSGQSEKSQKSNKSGGGSRKGSVLEGGGGGGSRKGSIAGGKEDEEEEEEETNVFSLLLESRNPWRKGEMANVGQVVPSLAGKLGKTRLDKLFAENPFRKYWFHEEEWCHQGSGLKEEDPMLRQIAPPDEFNWPDPPPPPPKESEMFSVQGSRTEWWPPRKPDVVLQQINELVQRQDNTKATSPPTPPEPSNNKALFTVGPSPRASLVKLGQKKTKTVACGESVPDMGLTAEDKHRNVKAQKGQSPPEVDYSSQPRGDKNVEELWPKKKYEGGTQTRFMLKELPSEDEKPAGMYEGYQESIKSKLSEEEDCDGDDERKIYYRKRREKRGGILKREGRRRLKRKEKFLHPCSAYSPEEEEEDPEDDKTNVPSPRDKQRQSVKWLISAQPPAFNPGAGTAFPPIHPGLPYSHPGPQAQQPWLVQTTPTPGAPWPLIARPAPQSTQATPAAMKLPFLQLSPMITSSPLVRNPPVLFTNSAVAPAAGAQSQQKYLPMITPFNSSNMRLVKLVQGPAYQQQPNSSLITTQQQQGPLQTKLVQMMMTPPQVQNVLLHQQQQLNSQNQPTSQLIYKQQ